MKIDIGNEIINYSITGEGKPFLMLHGNMSSSVHLNVLIDNLVDGVKLILPDMRGFGESTYNNNFDSLDELADDMILLLEKLEVKKCVVGGWSTGGGVALVIAAKRPDLVEKVVLVESVGATGYPLLKKDENGEVILEEYLKTKEEIAQDVVQVLPILDAYENKNIDILKAIWNGAIYTDIVPSDDIYSVYLEEMLKQRNLVDIDYSLTRFNITNDFNGVVEGSNLAKEITQPVLILQGKKDLVVGIEMAESLRSVLVNNQYILGDWGHSPFTDKPKEVCEIIFDYVKGD